MQEQQFAAREDEHYEGRWIRTTLMLSDLVGRHSKSYILDNVCQWLMPLLASSRRRIVCSEAYGNHSTPTSATWGSEAAGSESDSGSSAE